jgi:hypothetical protein
MQPSKADIIAASSVAWIADSRFITENRKPIEFTKHRFLIDYLHDNHPHKATKKSSQVGLTVAEMLDNFHLAAKRKMNVIHTMHTNDVIRGFVVPKVNPLIANNPGIQELMTKDSEGLKGFGDNFLYIRGANAESQAINISADVLKIDEKDRSNPTVVEMYESRMDFSEYRWIREFSNPSAIGFGVDKTYQESDQRHWFVKCTACNHNMYIDYEESDLKNHYVDADRLIFACGNPKCRREITNNDRINGEWVAKWPSRTKIHGYWFSQMMAPWFTAADIVDKHDTKSTPFFYNFVLGKAYTPSDLLIDRATILAAQRPGQLQMRNVVMGSDIGKPHWYWLGTPDGIFKVGKADSWDELERLFNLHKCEAWVMDSMPEFTKVQEMLRKYPGKAFAARYVKDTKEVGMVRFQEGDKRGFVYVDRTRAIDRVVGEVASQDIRFFVPVSHLEEAITHASNMYRTVETDEKGFTKVDWMTPAGAPDHLVHALVYWRTALEKAFTGLNSGVVETDPQNGHAIAPTVKKGKIEVEFDIQESLDRAEQQQ